MKQYTVETKIKEGNIEISNIPIADNTDVKVIIIPKIDMEKLNAEKISNLVKSIKGNMSDDIINSRN